MNSINAGKIFINSTNTSFCYAEHASGITITDALTGSCASFSSFCNTKASELIIYVEQSNFEFKFCNVLKNEYHGSEFGTLTAITSAEIKVNNCSFLGNIGPNSDFSLYTDDCIFEIENT